MKRKVRSVPIFNRILITVGLLILVELLVLVAFLFGSGIISELNKNSSDIMSEKVINRSSYLQHEMIARWANLSLTADSINAETQSRLSDGRLSLNDIDVNSQNCTSLLMDISDSLLSLLRNNAVTGSYVILSTQKLDMDSPEDKTGLYFRDLDPLSRPSAKNQDVLIVRAPVAVVRELGISTDNCWQPLYRFEEYGYFDCFYKPFTCAYNNLDNDRMAAEMSYWGTEFQLHGDDKSAMTYSMPLMLDDGTVYGVLGIDIVDTYLGKQLPYIELADDKPGAYALLHSTDAGESYVVVFKSGNAFAPELDKAEITLERTDNGLYELIYDGIYDDMLCVSQPLRLYDETSMFANEEWVLVGIMRENDLYAFSRGVQFTFGIVVIVVALTGLLGCYLTGAAVSRPIVSLIKKLKTVNPLSKLSLEDTGITEIDRLLSAIEALNSEVVTASVRFSTIMEMASVRIAGFELNLDDNSVFVTKRFFEIMGNGSVNTKYISVSDFIKDMQLLSAFVIESHPEEGSCLYKIPQGGEDVYVQLNYTQRGGMYIGLIEDTTSAVLDKERLERERDHDVLTSLKNRRAFQRIMEELFSEGAETLKTAALLMADLDDLKVLNDTYGHDCGDRYIRCAADCLLENTPPDALVTRVSGDEFYVFYYGYESRAQVEELIDTLKNAVPKYFITLPNRKAAALSMSCGMAWYPFDAASLSDILKYSDFAMYCVKRSGKGKFINFDLGVYERELELLENKAELLEIIENGKVYYNMQPIVDAATGEVFAYEALMRSDLPTLGSPDKILELARLESKLNKIEELTWFKALEAYAGHVESGRIEKGVKIFVNSIANQCLSPDKMDEFEGLYRSYLSDIVLEVTENEPQEKINHQYKINRLLHTWHGEVALDDYGSGYNSETALLSLNPKYIKVDLTIIRDIDTSSDKQKVLQNIVSYAHERDMKIIAEGIETVSELETVIRMGTDYLQGYYLGRPSRVPQTVPEAVKEQLRTQNIHLQYIK